MIRYIRRFSYKAMLILVTLSLILPAPVFARPIDQAQPDGPAAPHAIITVLNTDDSGPGSLRQAVLDANPGDTVTFTPTLAGQTIVLTTTQISVDKSITIDGSSAPGVTVSGNDDHRVFGVYAQTEVTINALTIVHGWVGEDTGGGISNAGTLTVSNSTLAYNDGMIGGGLYNDFDGSLLISNTTVMSNTANQAGGGLYNDGALAIFNSTVSGNEAAYEGGGAYNSSAGYGLAKPSAISMEIVNSTFSDNRVTDVEIAAGGGVLNRGPLSIVNSTFYGNTSAVSYRGGGLYNDEGADLSLANTVIAHSTGDDCVNYDTISPNIDNLIEDESCTADFSGDPLLGSLADNGGPTLTHLPLEDSPLIDMGDNDSAADLDYDQRGPGYPRIVNGTVDIGAVEAPAPILTVINDSPTVLSSPTNFTATLPSGYITTTWNFGDGSAEVSGVTPITTYTYSAVGFYTAVITATDGDNTLTGTTPVTITNCASGIVVVNTNDAGCGSLRGAVFIAQPGQTVTFAPALAGQVITLTTAEIAVDKSVTIDGSGAPGVQVSGDYKFRVFSVGTVVSTTRATLNALIIRDGGGSMGPNQPHRVSAYEGFGGGVFNMGVLTLTNSTLLNNSTFFGGGLANSGQASVARTVITNNFAYIGGGAANLAGFVTEGTEPLTGSLMLNDTDFQSNLALAGSGAANFGGNLTAANTRFTDNGTLLEGDTMGGGLFNLGNAAIDHSTFTDNAASRGGGLASYTMPGFGSFTAITVTDSTFSGNLAAYRGGGLGIVGSASLSRNRIFDNAALDSGGGLFVSGAQVQLDNNFIAANYSEGGAAEIGVGGQYGLSLVTGRHNTFASVVEGFGPAIGVGYPVESQLPPPTRLKRACVAATSFKIDCERLSSALLPDRSYGVAPAADLVNDTVVLTNSIVSGYAIGLQTNLITSTIEADGLLWWNVGTPTNIISGAITATNTYTGNPAFVDEAGYDYHLTSNSAAIDRAVVTNLFDDIDRTVRPLGQGFDLGADETPYGVILTAANNSPMNLGSPTNLTATLTGLMSPVAAYMWAFGDGATGTGATPTHAYPAVGVYTATVTATNGVLTLTASTPVTITQPPIRYTYLPLIMNNFFTAPDLIVQNIIASSNAITVVIKNVGDAPAAESFWVDAYVAPNPPPTAVNQIWWDQNRSQQGVAWAVTDPIVPILPGQVITLTSTDAYVSPERTYFTGTLPVGTPIYAQVDSYNFYTDYGAVRERHEIMGLPYNNIFGPVLSQAGLSSVLPLNALPWHDVLRYARLPARPVQP